MEIKVRVVPNAKAPSITKTGENSYRIKVNAPAIDGKANRRLIEILAEHFGKPKAKVRIIRSISGRDKTIEIDL